MIRRYRYGHPFDTEAVVTDIEISEGLPEVGRTEVTEKGFVWSCRMAPGDVVYGLGEQMRGINKRGHRYVSRNEDDMYHLESRESLYASHNFLILQPEITEDGIQRACFGLFIDHPGRVSFDAGFTHPDQLVIRCSADLDLYVITGSDPLEVTRRFRRIIGRSYIAPKWAFGVQQSRWGYVNEADVREVIDGYRAAGMPLDAVYMDIDYMEDYKDFTVDETRFPDFEGFTAECLAEGIHLVPIIDAGVKIQEGYDVYEEGVRNHYFCKNAEGKDFVAAVWPGRVHMPDFLKPQARAWFGGKYARLIAKGIDGFWNDMNEPALFYTEKSIDRVMDRILALRQTNMGIKEVFEMKGMVESLGTTDEEYGEFYHDTPQGRICHTDVHNLYGYNMTRAASEAFDRISPDKRILMFSRSSYIGSHRYGGIWTGDNASWWSHLLLALQQLPSLNMCGYLYSGSDVGGFSSDCTEDLMIRWMSFAIFTPLFRNHCVRDARRQEPYLFDDKEALRGLLQLRYALLPYLYSEYMKACLQDDLLFVPLGFAFPEDADARETEDQVMVGESIMIAPVYVPNAAGRTVYLPEDMLMIRMAGPKLRLAKGLPKGYHRVACPMGETLIFVRSGHVLPLTEGTEGLTCMEGLCEDHFLWIGCPGTAADYVLYQDDGTSRSYQPREAWKKYHFTAEDFAKDCIVRR